MNTVANALTVEHDTRQVAVEPREPLPASETAAIFQTMSAPSRRHIAN